MLPFPLILSLFTPITTHSYLSLFILSQIQGDTLRDRDNGEPGGTGIRSEDRGTKVSTERRAVKHKDK